MSNVTIDIDVLTAALAQALPVAIKAAVDASIQQADIPAKSKRGRPKKGPSLSDNNPRRSNFVLPNTEILNVEEENTVVEDDKPRNPSQGHIFTAKAFNRTNVLGVACGMEDVTQKRGKMKFMDIQNVGDRVSSSKYPEPTDRRPPAQKMKFECDRCSRNFEAYPSECPQAFVKEKITGVAEGKPRVLCDGCIGR